jgi:hypothetical protein
MERLFVKYLYKICMPIGIENQLAGVIAASHDLLEVVAQALSRHALQIGNGGI